MFKTTNPEALMAPGARNWISKVHLGGLNTSEDATSSLENQLTPNRAALRLARRLPYPLAVLAVACDLGGLGGGNV